MHHSPNIGEARRPDHSLSWGQNFSVVPASPNVYGTRKVSWLGFPSLSFMKGHTGHSYYICICITGMPCYDEVCPRLRHCQGHEHLMMSDCQVKAMFEALGVQLGDFGIARRVAEYVCTMYSLKSFLALTYCRGGAIVCCHVRMTASL